MSIVHHRTERCPRCGKDSYQSSHECLYGAKCVHCGAVVYPEMTSYKEIVK